MAETKKHAVSLRMSSADLRRIKRLGNRLGVRDSDVIRFAVKTMLAKLAPLCDPNMRGRALVPVFVESGPEMFQHFDLDAVRLDSIINEGLDDTQRVEQRDIQLLAMSGMHASYSRLSLRLLSRGGALDARPGMQLAGAHLQGPPPEQPAAAASPESDHGDGAMDDRPRRPVRNYLYSKYGYGGLDERDPAVLPQQKRSGR